MSELVERTEASLAKFKERAERLREDVGDARAATRVQMEAMIERLDQKYESAEKRFQELKSSSADTTTEMRKLHDEIVSDLQSMVKTINRRIR